MVQENSLVGLNCCKILQLGVGSAGWLTMLLNTGNAETDPGHTTHTHTHFIKSMFDLLLCYKTIKNNQLDVITPTHTLGTYKRHTTNTKTMSLLEIKQFLENKTTRT